jgi:hypothetical protein
VKARPCNQNPAQPTSATHADQIPVGPDPGQAPAAPPAHQVLVQARLDLRLDLLQRQRAAVPAVLRGAGGRRGAGAGRVRRGTGVAEGGRIPHPPSPIPPRSNTSAGQRASQGRCSAAPAGRASEGVREGGREGGRRPHLQPLGGVPAAQQGARRLHRRHAQRAPLQRGQRRGQEAGRQRLVHHGAAEEERQHVHCAGGGGGRAVGGRSLLAQRAAAAAPAVGQCLCRPTTLPSPASGPAWSRRHPPASGLSSTASSTCCSSRVKPAATWSPLMVAGCRSLSSSLSISRSRSLRLGGARGGGGGLKCVCVCVRGGALGERDACVQAGGQYV